MARTPKPWFRADRNAFFVTIGGVRHNLGSDPKEADRLFHALMANRSAPAPFRPVEPAVAEVLDTFLEWCQKHREPRTYDFYREHLQGFLNFLQSGFRVSDLKPLHVVRWSDSHAGWGPNRKRGAIIAVLRAFNWAAKIGMIDRSPVAGTEKPQPRRREQTVPAEHYTRMLRLVRTPIRDLLVFAWESGARPQETFRFEARHYNAERNRLELAPAEAKGKKRWRYIYLTDTAVKIIRRLVKAHPSGALFRNCKGKPWNKFAANCVFQRLKKKLGVKYALYSFRHTFCQRMLEAGVDHVTVAELMGHANAIMVATTYSHMNRAEEHLRIALKKAAGGDAA